MALNMRLLSAGIIIALLVSLDRNLLADRHAPVYLLVQEAAVEETDAPESETDTPDSEDGESDRSVEDETTPDLKLDSYAPEETDAAEAESSPQEKPTDDDPKSNTSTAAPLSTNFLIEGDDPQTVEQLQAMEQHFAELAERIAPATVNIQIGMAQGSGVVVSRDGYILTAAHVIGRPNATAVITFPDGTKVKAKTLGMARRSDSGMLKILEEEGKRFPHLDVGLSSDLTQGQWVMAVGHPGGIDPKRGLVFRVGRIIANSFDKLQTDCTLVGGDSGGPLVDMNGEVIGIHSRIGSQLWDNLHAPIDVYSEKWDQMEKGWVLDGNPYLGFQVKPKTNRVASVTKESPADKAGLKKNDRIIKVGQSETPDHVQLRNAIARLHPYEKTTFTVKRRSKNLKLDVTVKEDR